MAQAIKTTHVGSLIRPPELIAHLRAQADGKDYDAAAHAQCLSCQGNWSSSS